MLFPGDAEMMQRRLLFDGGIFLHRGANDEKFYFTLKFPL
jgi:hypothetical protein